MPQKIRERGEPRRYGEKRGLGGAEECGASRAGGEGGRRIRARRWKRCASVEKEGPRPELVKVFGRLKRTGDPSTAYIRRPYPGRPAVSIEMRFFFQGAAPCHVNGYPIMYARPRTETRTSGLYIGTTYITGSKTAATLLPLLLLRLFLLLLFPCFFIVLLVSVNRLVRLPLSRLYIDHDATSSPMYPFVRPSVRLAYRFRRREYREDSHLHSDGPDGSYHDRVPNVLLSFPRRTRRYSSPSGSLSHY